MFIAFSYAGYEVLVQSLEFYFAFPLFRQVNFTVKQLKLTRKLHVSLTIFKKPLETPAGILQ